MTNETVTKWQNNIIITTSTWSRVLYLFFENRNPILIYVGNTVGRKEMVIEPPYVF